MDERELAGYSPSSPIDLINYISDWCVMMVRATFTPQAESNELNVNIKTVSRPEESLFEIWGGVVWDRAMEEEYTIILTVYGVCC